jgi:hypothetical protein
LAALEEAIFEHYIATRKAKGERITRAGALRLGRSSVAPAKDRARRPDCKTDDGSTWLPVWDAVQNAVKIDLTVGVDPTCIKAAHRLNPGSVTRKQLSGNVLVKADDRIDEWLNVLHEAKRAGAVVRAILLFAAPTGEPWFKLIDEQGWTCCFLRGGHRDAAIVAWLCDNPRPLALALSRLGAVLHGSQAWQGS